ncbi:MAG: prolyl oligopeptidase family serine peptidase [Candidatus Hydrogenedentes bacterium]|nr:prolyl oligopeptidase family serine peptidase [Candidatus Hydrogenedentota bacterium]
MSHPQRGGQTLDAVAAGEWLRPQPYIAKVGIYGQSYGGFLTLHAIVAAPDLLMRRSISTARRT